MRTGALIAAAGKAADLDISRPMLKLNQTTMIQRLIDTLRSSGVSPIVVVTGYEADDLEKHIAHRSVICLRNDKYVSQGMLESVKLGLDYIRDQCDQVLICPAASPMFSRETLEELMTGEREAAVPVHSGKWGHPVLLSGKAIPKVISFEGEEGLRGALKSLGASLQEVEVFDPGILLRVNDEETYQEILNYENMSLMSNELKYKIQLMIGRGDRYFDPGVADFLELVDRTGSMLAACKQMEMSYSKGWKMVKSAEEFLGITFLCKQVGGAGGGNSKLTPEGSRFLHDYRRMQRDVDKSANAFFHLYFGDRR